MNSEFMTMLGLDNLDVGYIFLGITVLLLILIICFIVLIVQYAKLKKRYNKFMKGKNASSLEDDIDGIFHDMKLLKTNVDKNKRDIRVLYKNMESTFQKVGIVKYDAFSEMGGKLSFALALLDKNNNGFIINSMHGRDGCYTYIKEIVKGESYILLGEEEKQALELAIDEDDLMEDLKEFKEAEKKRRSKKEDQLT